MTNLWRSRGRLAALFLSGSLLAGGCFSRFENNLDIFLSPDAFSNALRLPTSGVAPLFEFLLRALRG